MTKKQKTLAVVGGVAVAALVVGGVAYAMSKQQPAIPSGPSQPSLVPVTALTQGKNYGFSAQVSPGIGDAATLTNQLQAAGWTNVQIEYFGPTANGVAPPAGLPFSIPGAIGTAYVASGTWNGATGTAVPSGVVAVQVS